MALELDKFEKIKKVSKRVLTKAKTCDILNKLSPRAAENIENFIV